MAYDKALLEEKLGRWQVFVRDYNLPAWESIPAFGLYMDQVVMLLQEYLPFLPAGEKDSPVTAAAINNYVRLKLMPPPVKKKYGRVHVAYLVMILTLKLSLSITQIGRLLPHDPDEAAAQRLYEAFRSKLDRTRQQFCGKLQQLRQETAAPELGADSAAGQMIFDCAMEAAVNALLAGKLIALAETDGADRER